MSKVISLLLLGAGIGFIINLAAVLLEMGLKSWGGQGNKNRILKNDFRNIKISSTHEMMRLVNPDYDDGKEFKETSNIENDGLNWSLSLKFLSSMALWAVVVYFVARDW